MTGSIRGGMVVTRFPPEPSGRLHIGHAKAMEIDFGFATEHGGECILRMDDTNPDTATQELVDAAVSDCEWLGHRPCKLTFTSDYFAQLHAYAKALIEAGHAYVCHLPPERLSAHRRADIPSPWRGRSIAESSDQFTAMNEGGAEGAVLRLKTPDGCDPVAYRIKTGPHFRTGDKWRVYPSYDMSHCVVDALEGVTHSFCTREFYDKRDNYFWLLRVLGLPQPEVFEFSRLNIRGAVTSKRRLRAMIAAGEAESWDDPRLFTLCGLRRRGVPPAAIREFCKGLNMTTVDSEVPELHLFRHVTRELSETAPRGMAVSEPLRLELEGVRPAAGVAARAYPQMPGDSRLYSVPLPDMIYIDARDFRLQGEPSYHGLTPGKCVWLRYVGVMRHLSHVVRERRIESVRCELLPVPVKCKGVITWVPELRKYGDLYGGARLAELAGSLVPYQVERVGYFAGGVKVWDLR